MCVVNNLICFQHCCTTYIFCKTVPEKCPICDNFLTTLLLEPFVIPYPLVNAKDYPCSIVVRPSVGSFLDDYNVNNDLHIGITNSSGMVIEYDECGLVRDDGDKWKCCASIRLIPESWVTFWDENLNKMCNDVIWNANNYDNAEFNCFNFVISFLKELKYSDIQFMNKVDMCKEFILPRIQNILKYVSLCNYLKDKEVYVQD
ncbi:PREDICTED: MKRN2 opposite strand protein [Ceratosolen solmsi marchali]|uniref:MKRN2 opposite strand protein n=1 Tax=Ceratosolen solmsi marchali TaxID=326594 RepID=A0AAJ6YLZ0_9HYME|nr:PREDICTED: MKRN2 opposite strand protein [Ceratosolen solmsi marchali]